MGASVVQHEDRDGVRWIRLDRPHKHNALDVAVRDELDALLRELEDRGDLRVVVLSGNGPSFSAGADLGMTGPSPQPQREADGPRSASPWAARRRGSGGWQRVLERLEAIPQVTVASVHGHCIGGGALLAVACDLRVIAESAQVRIPELAIGIPLTWAGVPRLVREVGFPLARDLVLTARVLSGPEAVACGFAQRLSPDDGLAAATDALVGELLAMPEAPLALTRDLFAAMGRAALGATAWADADVLAWSLREPEGQAAAEAYLARRRGGA